VETASGGSLLNQTCAGSTSLFPADVGIEAVVPSLNLNEGLLVLKPSPGRIQPIEEHLGGKKLRMLVLPDVALHTHLNLHC
jgi:hypothetical protein